MIEAFESGFRMGIIEKDEHFCFFLLDMALEAKLHLSLSFLQLNDRLVLLKHQAIKL